jgi:hypothetical protein
MICPLCGKARRAVLLRVERDDRCYLLHQHCVAFFGLRRQLRTEGGA